MSIPENVQTVIKELYAASDAAPTPSTAEAVNSAYANLFIPDGTLVMGPLELKGQEAIKGWRVSAWEAVAARKHVVTSVFPSPAAPEREFMLHGTVQYTLKDGSSPTPIEWAGRVLLDGKGENKIEFYQVWLTKK